MKTIARLLGLVTLVAATSAFAGVADTPLPQLQAGATTYHLYTVPGGVVSRDAVGLATYFSCTSTDTSELTVGIEVFDSNAYLLSDAAATSAALLPGHSVLFATGASFNELFAVNLNTGSISSYLGSARILATSKKLICTAFVADKSTVPQTLMMQLPLIAKTKQKAAN